MAAQTPVNGTAYTFYIYLQSMANPGSFQIDPTLAAGDFQISKDGGAFSNLTTLPDAEPNGTAAVRVQLSSGEMTADNVTIRGVDQTSPKEWADYAINIQPQAAGPLTAAAVVDEWETQSQADPTGFHVNVVEIGGTTQTANDNGADINAILVDTNELQGDWTNGGRLDLIIDAILDDTDLIDDGTSGLAKIATDVAAVLVDTGTTLDGRIPAALVGGRMDATIDATGMESGAVDNIWDEVLEGSYTARQLMRLFTAALGGIVAGAGTTTITFRNTGDSKDVITATVDVNGNRSAVTLDLT